MSMNCPLKSEDTLDVLLDYSAGRLEAARLVPFEAHMAECGECSAFCAGQAGVWQALETWEPEPVGMDFNRRMWKKIDTAAAAPWYRKLADSLRMGAWKPALPLAAIVVMVAVGFGVDHQAPAPANTTAVSAAGVSVTEAEQLEKTLDDVQLLQQLDAATVSSRGDSKPL